MKAARRSARGGLSADQTLTLMIQPRPGIAPRQERELERDLAEYLLDRDLIADGTQLYLTVRAEGRAIGIWEQVDLMHWLLTCTPVCSLRVCRHVGDLPAEDPPWIVATHADKALRPLLDLYGMGRLDPQTVLRVLAGITASNAPSPSSHTPT